MNAVKSRTYPLSHHANDAKLESLRELLPVWQSCLVAVQLVQTRRLREGIRLGWLEAHELNALRLPLSARQLKSVTNQVNAALRSWQALTVKNVRTLIRDGAYTPTERHELNSLNVKCNWWSDPRTTDLVTRSLAVTPFPNMGRVRVMLMDTTVCKSEEATSGSFDRWVRVSTLHKGHPVLIPVTESDYYRHRVGEEAGITQVAVRRDGVVSLSRVKQSEVAERRPVGDTIGLDWGVVNMFTTSDGRRLGQQVYAHLKELDGQLVDLTRALQANGVKPRDSKRYRALNSRIRSHVRNEVGRILNKIASEENISELVTENLDFRDGGMSAEMNRILSRAGRGAVKEKLSSLTEDFGITVTEVNPAYTSQECSGCGFAAKSNRRSQSRFQCRFCGKTCNADVKAAVTIAKRRSLHGDGLRWHTKHSVLTIIDQNFLQRWGVSAADIRQRHTRGHSTATSASSAA